MMTSWAFSNGAFNQSTATGTYTVGSDCSINLSFANNSSNGSTSGASGSLAAPLTFSGLLPNATNGASTLALTGLITVQPVSGANITGIVIPQ